MDLDRLRCSGPPVKTPEGSTHKAALSCREWCAGRTITLAAGQALGVSGPARRPADWLPGHPGIRNPSGRTTRRRSMRAMAPRYARSKVPGGLALPGHPRQRPSAPPGVGPVGRPSLDQVRGRIFRLTAWCRRLRSSYVALWQAVP
jgi:hypothetical protein